MFDQIPLDDDTLYHNPEPRCPVVLVLDASGSMQGNRISELNAGLRAFESDLQEDLLAQKRCEIAVLSFGRSVQLVSDFVAASQFHPTQLTAGGNTPLGEAMNRALELLEARKAQYRQAGLKYYRPWVFLLSDGAPTDRWQEAAARVKAAEEAGQLACFAFGVDGADFQVLREFSGKRSPQQLRGNKFREMFLWLSSSLKRVSMSTPGTAVQLQKPGDDWTV